MISRLGTAAMTAESKQNDRVCPRWFHPDWMFACVLAPRPVIRDSGAPSIYIRMGPILAPMQ